LCCRGICRRALFLREFAHEQGTILWINPYDLDGDGIVGDICQVLWDNGRKGHYRTGYDGEFRLALFEVPKPRLSVAQQNKIKDEIVIQKDVPARVGMRVIARPLALALSPELEKISRGNIGSIVSIEGAVLEEGIEYAASVEVVWDGSNIKHKGLANLRPPFLIFLWP
jgi:hypothetical protein